MKVQLCMSLIINIGKMIAKRYNTSLKPREAQLNFSGAIDLTTGTSRIIYGGVKCSLLAGMKQNDLLCTNEAICSYLQKRSEVSPKARAKFSLMVWPMQVSWVFNVFINDWNCLELRLC